MVEVSASDGKGYSEFLLCVDEGIFPPNSVTALSTSTPHSPLKKYSPRSLTDLCRFVLVQSQPTFGESFTEDAAREPSLYQTRPPL